MYENAQNNFSLYCYYVLGCLTLKENSSGRNGLMADLSVECSSCLEATPLKTSDTITKKGQSFDVNRRAVYHSLETGGGYEGLVTVCSIMNMPCLSLPAYYKQVDTILEALEAEAKDEMTQAGIRVREYILKESGDEVNDDVVDAAVSFDGTWAKRGFTSLTGVVFVISVDTGEVLDYHVLSKECRKCTMKRSQCQTDEEFEAWQIEHLASNACDINFNGSSPAMEAEGAIVVWSRSVELHKIRYKWMVSDGDSKAFNTVENIYGDDCKVEKLDCVGHVQKRMGKHLLNLKARTKGKLADGKPIGGRGRLTESRIKRLQKYYGLAIRQNTLTKANLTEREVDVAVYTMKKNIIAILHHSVQSQDAAKQHRFCPVGEDSWCKWQQDCATGTNTYEAGDCLPEVFFELLKPTFITLSETKLLQRCVRGATQNRNECINGLVWARCPKHKHHGAKVIRCAVASTVCHFHSGAASRARIMQRLAIPAGEYTQKASEEKDKRRLRKSDLQTSAKEKKRRQGEQMRRTRREDALREADGDTYEPGGF